MSTTNFKWEKLSPSEFQHLQELASYSTRKLQDVLQDFCSPHSTPRFNPDGDIDYDGFKCFLDAFLDCETPEELCKHLFISFFKPNTQYTLQGKALNQMAALSSNAACAPVTAHNKGSIPSINNIVEITPPQNISNEPRQSFVDKIHGITDKLQSLSYLGHDTSSENRSKSGTIHPLVTVTPSPLGGPNLQATRRSTESSPSHSHSQNHSQMSRNSSKKSNNSVNLKNELDIKLMTRKLSYFDPLLLKVQLKDVVCYLSLLEAGRPEDKLEFMFRLYDTDGNGVLDTAEMDAIVNQMMSVAEYIGWDVSELRPILQDMMIEIDYDGDGNVSLEEWQRGGMTTIPLLVLLGVDNTALKEDGIHVWRLKHFSKPAYCNLCLNMLVGLGKKGLCCVLCKYTVHERCVQHAPASCITTYVKSKKAKGGVGTQLHHWVDGNCYGRCSKCRKRIKAHHGLTCRWCHMMLHNRCAASLKKECNLGEYANLIVPPTAICPAVLERQKSVNQSIRSKQSIPSSASTVKAQHFQITPITGTCPLLVFVNPKSGGRQGDRILRKFQYMLNPRQVYDLTKGGPIEGLTLFKDLPNFKVICCGGDGTVGWVLEAMDSIEFKSQPAIGVIPLGTGNDLARCLRWGGGYEGESIPKLMHKISRSTTVWLDRWSIEVKNNSNTIFTDIPKPKVTLQDNVQKIIDLPEPIVVEKSVINEYSLTENTKSISTTTTESSTDYKEFQFLKTTTSSPPPPLPLDFDLLDDSIVENLIYKADDDNNDVNAIDKYDDASAGKTKIIINMELEKDSKNLRNNELIVNNIIQDDILHVEETDGINIVCKNFKNNNYNNRNYNNNNSSTNLCSQKNILENLNEDFQINEINLNNCQNSQKQILISTNSTQLTEDNIISIENSILNGCNTNICDVIIQRPIKVQSEKDFCVPYNIINNYFSVGVDAAICVKFHLEREKNPNKFNSRMKNKLWYFEYATSETFAASCKNLHEDIDIECDGLSLDLMNGPQLQGIALLNIPYTHGGSNLWGEHLSKKRIRKYGGPFNKGKKLRSSNKELSSTSFNSVDLSVAIQDIGDNLIEVIGLENCLHMGQVRTGLRASGRRLAQCSEVTIKTKKTFPMQIDGEPWMQSPCTIKVTHKNQVPMLMAPRSEKGKGLFSFCHR